MTEVYNLAAAPHTFGLPYRLRDTRALLQKLAQESVRPMFVFALDGIPYQFAANCWSSASVYPALSETPTSSAPCWLSSVTGLSPIDHGALGAVQRFGIDDREAQFIFSYAGGTFGAKSTVFDDMRSLGRRVICSDSDLCGLDGAWRDALTHGAEYCATGPFFAGAGRASAREIVERIADCIEAWVKDGPEIFVWTFIDIDLYIHHNGYDNYVKQMLILLDGVFARFASIADIVAYSDHGLVPTRHDPVVAAVLEDFCILNRLELAGAGRMRWLYNVDPSRREMLLADLGNKLPAGISLHAREEIFPEFLMNDRFCHRVGEIVMIATAENFLTDPDYRFDHGGLSEIEMSIPFALWRS